jgi:hypothetical protein
MNELLNIGNLLVGAGGSAILVTLIGALFQRRMNQANYTRALVETANDFADRVDVRNQRLEDKVTRLEGQIDKLDDRIVLLSEQLRIAIPIIQEAGHEAKAAAMRAALGS